MAMVQFGKLKIGTDEAAVERAKGRAEAERIEAMEDLEYEKRLREEEAREAERINEIKSIKFSDNDTENIELLGELLSDYFSNQKDYNTEIAGAAKSKIAAFYAVPERKEKFSTQYIQFLRTNAYFLKEPDTFDKHYEEWKNTFDINSLTKYWAKVIDAEVQRQLKAEGKREIKADFSNNPQKKPTEYNWTVVLVVAIVTGWFGGHRYLVGRTKSAVLYTFTMGVMFVGWVLDILNIVMGRFQDGYGNCITRKKEDK